MTAKNKTLFLKHLNDICYDRALSNELSRGRRINLSPHIFNSGFISAEESKSVEASLMRFNNL